MNSDKMAANQIEMYKQIIVPILMKNDVDKVIVVGSPTSSNTKLLYAEVAKIAAAKMVADHRSIHKNDIEGYKKFLVVSGTSAPPEIVEKVVDKVRSLG